MEERRFSNTPLNTVDSAILSPGYWESLAISSPSFLESTAVASSSYRELVTLWDFIRRLKSLMST